MGSIFTSEPVANINKYCRNIGFILIGLGIIHFILSGILDGMWGGLLIIIGIISLCYRAKSMLIIFGSALILVGILNISNIIYEISGFWVIFGIFQIVWGIQEIRKYKKTKENPKYVIKKEEKRDFIWYGLRIVLGLMILFEILNIVYGLEIQDTQTFGVFFWFFLFLFMVIFIVGFMISILHLVKYKKKGIAIFTLLFSVAVLLLFVFSLITSLLAGGIGDFSNEQIIEMEDYCQGICGEIEESDYILVDFDSIKEMPICYCLDGEEVVYDEDIPSWVYS
jgi:MFS family permease